MGEFGLDQAAVRIAVALAFAAAAAAVVVRMVPRPVRTGRGDPVAAGCPSVAGDHESGAAHVLMCAVMSVMVLFPARAHAPALHGVLLAMLLVFGLLVVARTVRGRSFRPGRAGALGYHLLAAGVMLTTMSAHSGSGPGALLALVFLADAVAVLVTALRGGRLWWAVHPAVTGRVSVLAVLPHTVMDLGMAYMVAATGWV